MSQELLQNHFEIFALPVSFRVDAEVLSRHYRELQRNVHPDRFANASDQERRLSVQRAAQINEGYRILKDPLARAPYLLELRGVNVADENNTAMDPEFLMEQMELREALEEVRQQDNPLAVVGRLIGTIEDRLRELQESLAVRFERGSQDDLIAARETVHKLQFFHRLRDEALDMEASLEDALI